MASGGRRLFLGIAAGAVLGLAGALVFGPAMAGVAWLGELFLNALQMLIVPLLLATVVHGVCSLGDVRQLGRMGALTVGYYLATTTVAVGIGLVLVNLIRPGDGVELEGLEVSEEVEAAAEAGWEHLPLSLVSESLLGAMVELELLPVIVFAIAFAAVLTTVGEVGEPVRAFFAGANAVMLKLVRVVMLFAPVGVFGLVGARFGGAGDPGELMAGLGAYMATVVLGLAVHALVVLPLILRLLGGRPPHRYAMGMGPALLTAGATASSSATLPVTLECVTDNNRVSPKAASFVLPIGSTVNMDGTALYEAVVAVFVAQAVGVDLTFAQQLTVMVTATLAAIGAAGIPEAGLVTMVIVLKAVDLPVDAIGTIVVVDWFLDRLRTATNVWGDSVGAAVISRV